MTAENTTNSLVFQIDQLLEEASKLAKTESDSSKFFDTLLQRAVLPVKAQSAAIWMLGPDSHPVAVSRYQSSGLRHHSEKTRQAIDHTIRESIESGQAKKLGANGKTSMRTSSSNQGEQLSVFVCPYDSGSGSTDSAVALYFADRTDRELDSVYASFTEAIAEIAAEFADWKKSTRPMPADRSAINSEATSDWNRFKLLSDALHENLNVRSTAVSLVNLGRKFYSCDRVLLAQRSGRNFKIIAASGAATINRKSETVAAVESLLAKGFYRNDKPIVFNGSESAPPRLEDALERYQSVSGHDFLLLSPLPDRSGRVRFVQVIESARENDVGEILKRVKIAEPQTRSAFSNAALYQSIPLRGLLGAFGGSRIGGVLSRLFAPLAILSLIGLGIAALCLIQTDMTVVAEGNVVAETEKNIFAAKDGVITQLNVGHGDQVQVGQLLIEMSSNKIEADLSRISSSIETEKKRLSAIEAVKSSIDRGTREGQRELGNLASQEIESQQQIENLKIEQAQLEIEKGRLQLKSPIDGTVVTREAKTKLLDRPVRRGDALLRLVANGGKWLAEIRVPDSRIAHLMQSSSVEAKDESKNLREVSVPVTLSVATFPELKFDGVICGVSNTAETDEATGQTFIVVTVEIVPDDQVAFQSGSSVVAEFNCGKASVGYAWFNEFIDSVRYRFF